jgi:hypothetical protein
VRVHLSAQVQSIIVAYAKANPSEVMTVASMKHNASLVEIGAQDHHISNAFQALMRGRLPTLARVRMGSGKTRFGYELRVKPKPVEPVVVPTMLPMIPDLKINVDRETGVLGLEFKGLKISISVT